MDRDKALIAAIRGYVLCGNGLAKIQQITGLELETIKYCLKKSKTPVPLLRLNEIENDYAIQNKSVRPKVTRPIPGVDG